MSHSSCTFCATAAVLSAVGFAADKLAHPALTAWDRKFGIRSSTFCVTLWSPLVRLSCISRTSSDTTKPVTNGCESAGGRFPKPRRSSCNATDAGSGANRWGGRSAEYRSERSSGGLIPRTMKA